MTTTSFTLENLNRAAINVWDNEILPNYMFSEFRCDLDEMWTDSLQGALENFDVGGSVEDNEGDAEGVAGDFLDHLAGEFDYRAGYDPAHDWVDSRLIYTADIMNFYGDNTAECDEALSEFDASDCGSIAEIISVAAHCVMVDQAQNELEEIRDNLENQAYLTEFTDYLRDEVAGN